MSAPLPAVTVSCRIRPRNPKADMPGGGDCLFHDEFSVRPADRHNTFTFDNVFGGDATQTNIFEKTSKPLVDAALSGINVTLMTYGQVRDTESRLRGGRRNSGVLPTSRTATHSYARACRRALERRLP